MANNKMSGCAFGKVTRNMVENLIQDHQEFKTFIKGEFKELKETNTNLYNHLSSRMPAWVTVAFTIMGSLITGLVVWGLSR